MRLAVMKVRKGMGVKKTAQEYGVPVSTLWRRARATGEDFSPKLGRGTVFGSIHERDLENYLLKMEALGFGLSRKDVKSLAFDFAEKNKIKHFFNKHSKSAGRYWLAGFLSRHTKLSLRKAEGLSRARAMGMNRSQVMNFFKCLEEVYKREGFFQTPERIYNVDEINLGR